MTFRLAKVLKGYQPVLCLPDALLLWRRGTLYRADFALDRIERVCDIPTRYPLLTRFAPQLAARILRFGIRSAAMLDDDNVLLSQRGEIFRVSLATGECVRDFEIPAGRRLLALSIVADTATGTRAACFGEYFHNVDKAEVAIWRRGPGVEGRWSVSARFPAGEIEHVHNICQTRDGEVHILAGDLGRGAGLWRSTFALDTLTPVKRGDQKYRACWLWQSPDGVNYYATDSHLEPNRLLSFLPGAEPAEIAPIAGSSIYAGEGQGYACFSSSVEPGEPSGSVVRDFTERRPGPGIAGDAAAIYVLESGEVDEILRARMDGWPLRLAQFATFSFPSGTMPENRLFAFGRAVRGYDGACLMFERGA